MLDRIYPPKVIMGERSSQGCHGGTIFPPPRGILAPSLPTIMTRSAAPAVKKNRAAGADAAVGEGTRENAGPDPHPQVEVEYVPEKADLDVDDPLLGVFTDIFEKFNFTVLTAAAKGEANEKEVSNNAAKKKGSDVDDDERDAQKKGEGAPLSNKQKKQLQRMKIAELKKICNKPDVVEVWDATAVDPKLLVYLKSYRNTVPVPRHWSQKRKFLQGLL